jgi:hypothetical protein
MRLRILVIFISAFMLMTIPVCSNGEVNSISSKNEINNDIHSLAVCREGLAGIIAFAESRPDLFSPGGEERKRLLSRKDKMEVWGAWSAVLDYTATLDSIGARYNDFLQSKDNAEKRETFSLRYAAFLTEYRYALEFISRAEDNSSLDTILNDQVPELGIPADSYSRFKLRFLNIARATEFAALQAVDKGLSGKDGTGMRKSIDEDCGIIWRMGKGKGTVLTFANGLAIVGKAGFAAWFPVQKGVSEWMGDVKVRHEGISFISEKQISKLRPLLRPGDILLERHEWYLSNLGLPGFWTHAALYVGTAAERKEFFNDHEVKKWVRASGEKSGQFEDLLRTASTSAYETGTAAGQDGHLPRIIEAISEGVSFTSLEHSAAADSLAVLRPRLSKREKAEAIMRAFHYSGRPYDFNFDFRTDSALVCSELVYKVYEPSPGMRGMTFPLTKIMGRKISTPNDMARQFSEQFGTPEQQSDLVVFLDGQEKTFSAVQADDAEFRQSWKRPKWHVLTQKALEEPK